MCCVDDPLPSALYNYGSDVILILYLTLLYAVSTLIQAGTSVYARFFQKSMNLYTAYVPLMATASVLLGRMYVVDTMVLKSCTKF